MRLWAAFLSAFLVALVHPTAALAEIVHTVAKGQTLGAIAKRYRISIPALREANDLRPGQPIHPGLKLVIPEKGKEAEASRKAAKEQAGRDRKATDPKKAGKDAKDPKDPKALKDKGKPGEKAKATGKDKLSEREKSDKANNYARKPKRPGLVTLVRGSERVQVQLLTRRGKLMPAALSTVSRMLRFDPTGAKTPIDPRLVTLIGMVSDHFGGRPIHVVSGFRPYSPRQYTRHSKHNLGHAMDFSVEGVPNTVVRDFCRSFRNSGVGYYPNSTFVHLDVRTTKVYWVDYSRPGEPPRYDSHHAQAAADESVGDVEAPGSTDQGGSRETPNAPSQGGETTPGNQDGADAPGVRSPGPGQSDPPSPAPPSTP